MTSNNDSEFDWGPTREFVGKDIMIEPKTGIDAVERSAIRRQMEVLEFDCPLHFDDAIAQKYGYGGVFAPAHMIQVFQTASMWEPGIGTIWPTDDPHFTNSGTGRAGKTENVPSPGTAGFVTDLEVETLKPLYLGERVTQVSQTLLDVNPRKTRVGDGAFLTYESMFQNQDGVSVGRQLMVSYTYIPNPQAGGAAAAAGGGEKPARTIEPRANPSVDWDFQRYWEDVNEGDEVPAVHYPLTIQRMVMAAGANRDFNAIHHNTVVAQAGGAADMYAMNYFHNGMWERVAREFIGLGGKIKQIGSFRMRVFSTVGDTVVTGGTVKRKWQENGENLVELELTSVLSTSGNTSVGPGPIIATLPSKS